MKYISVIFLFLSLLSFSQTDSYNYKFTYKIGAKLDLENENRNINQNMSLYVGKQKSLYISDVMLKVDSARAAIKKRRGSFHEIGEFQKTLPKNKLRYSLQKEYKARNLTYTYSVLPSQSLYYVSSIPIFNWKIRTEQKQILGYTCQKATLNYKGRKYIAWFSAEIPIQNGPWTFSGLPGLIFEIADTQNHYTFDLVGFKKETKSFPKLYEKAIKTTKKGFRNAVENILINLENSVRGESKLRLKKQRIARKKIKGNPIEIEE